MKVWTTLILSAAILLPRHMLSAEVTSEATGFEKRCHHEVVTLHAMIEGWLAGTVPNTDEAYLRFSDAMAHDFEIISPMGTLSDRDAIVSSLRAAHGSRGQQFSIAIRNIRTRILRPPLALLTYEEWQFEEGRAKARLSSVLLRDDPSKPGGVAWVHLQETWLQGPSPGTSNPVPESELRTNATALVRDGPTGVDPLFRTGWAVAPCPGACPSTSAARNQSDQ